MKEPCYICGLNGTKCTVCWIYRFFCRYLTISMRIFHFQKLNNYFNFFGAKRPSLWVPYWNRKSAYSWLRIPRHIAVKPHFSSCQSHFFLLVTYLLKVWWQENVQCDLSIGTPSKICCNTGVHATVRCVSLLYLQRPSSIQNSKVHLVRPLTGKKV